ncbi:unnamed protein product [Danaus chrysippus]|uniref:(African queen) hypothetical protein n=1 Tax=Danaus chrysippus TaxID=151541 RepID=A0A8J2WB82_9NEOP|nr:unnamed protein product [Danaus chrysippus]
MSGRDRDIGRKWECGSAKRKRKAERTATNQVLSSNMMKFLNQTATEPSESIPSTQQASEILLKNATSSSPASMPSSSSQAKFDAETLMLSSNNQVNSDPEHFMRFLDVTETTGEYLANAILEHLQNTT